MAASINCPICSGELEVRSDDLRGEWERIYYYCSTCDETYERLITFKTQSSMTAKDEWVGLATEPHHIVMYYDDAGGHHPIIAILETDSLEEVDIRIAIADYLIEEHDWDIEDVVESKEHVAYFHIDSDVVERLQAIVWPDFLTPAVVRGNPPTAMEAQTQLAVCHAFRIGE